MTAETIETPVQKAPVATMAVTVSRTELLEALDFAMLGLPTRPPLPILACIKIETLGSNSVRISSFDYEVSTSTVITALNGVLSGETLVVGRTLRDIVKIAEGSTVTVEQLDRQVTVKSGDDEWSLIAHPVDDYPSLPTKPNAVFSTIICGNEFVDAVTTVATALGRDDTLPVLTGLRIEIGVGKVTMAATDRYRLTVRDIDVATTSEPVDLLAHGSLVQVTKWFKKAKRVDDVKLSHHEGILFVDHGPFHATVRLLDGEFPKYRALMPDVATLESFTFDAKDAIKAIKKANVVADRNTPVKLDVTESSVLVQAGAGDESSARIPLTSAVDMGAEPFNVGFNPAFLTEGVTAVGGERVSLCYSINTKPAVIVGATGTQYLIMPVRLSG